MRLIFESITVSDIAIKIEQATGEYLHFIGVIQQRASNGFQATNKFGYLIFDLDHGSFSNGRGIVRKLLKM